MKQFVKRYWTGWQKAETIDKGILLGLEVFHERHIKISQAQRLLADRWNENQEQLLFLKPRNMIQGKKLSDLENEQMLLERLMNYLPEG